MEIRSFRREDASALVELSIYCGRGESDFVLNPYWETSDELFAEFDRFGIDPEQHLLVADAGDGEVLGLAGYLRRPGETAAGIFCPIVKRATRGRGVGGQLLRGALELGGKLGIKLATAGIGTRNRAGYSLLTSHGFRPLRQHYLMRCDGTVTAPEPPAASFDLETAGPEDVESILTIYSACGFEDRGAEAMTRVLTDGRHSHVVARSGGAVVAFAEVETHWPRRVWLAYVGVDPQLRDRGLGSAIVAFALERCFSAGAESALLMLSPANRTALRAYEKVGFRRHRLVDVLEYGL